jgi:cephalosporin hydroxylase
VPVSDWMLDQAKGVVVAGESTWMGVRALKWPLDAWIYQEIIYETRPEVVVELGSAFGGGTLFLAQMLDLAKIDGSVVTVDHNHDSFAAEHDRIIKITGKTGDPQTVEAVQRSCGGRSTMVIHDASHVGTVVLDDLRNYGSLVSPGNYLIVEDGINDQVPASLGGHAEPGPLWAARKFLDENPDFELDPRRERYGATYNPEGFLRRKGGS